MDQPAAKPSENPASAEGTRETSKDRRARRGKGKKPRRADTGATRITKFMGSTEALKDYNYDLCYNMGDQYTKTTRAIAEYVGR